MDPLKIIFLLNMVIFHYYVSLPKGTFRVVFSPFPFGRLACSTFLHKIKPFPLRIRAAADVPTIRPEVLLIWGFDVKAFNGFSLSFFFWKLGFQNGMGGFVSPIRFYKQPLLILFFVSL